MKNTYKMPRQVSMLASKAGRLSEKHRKEGYH